MDLAEYIFKSNKESKEISSLINCNVCTVSNIKMRNNSPGLLISLKLFYLSNGEIKFEDLLSHKDVIKFKKWKETIDSNKNLSPF
jgi:hypothetical protein